MKTEFTKGEWHVDEDNYVMAGYENGGVTIMEPNRYNLPENEMYANAKLIAAAPEMLAALKYCVALLTELGYKNGSVCQNAIKAIKKATELPN